MIFVVMATMIKQSLDGNHVRGSSMLVLNGESEEDARGQFARSTDTVSHILDGWTLGPVDILQVPPEKVLADEDTANFAREKYAA